MPRAGIRRFEVSYYACVTDAVIHYVNAVNSRTKVEVCPGISAISSFEHADAGPAAIYAFQKICRAIPSARAHDAGWANH